MTIISRSKERNRIVGYFLINPEKKHYINEMASMFGMYPANVNKKLKELEREGLLKSEFVGNIRFYYINKQFPLLKQYKEIFQKTMGIEKKIKDTFEKDNGIQEVYIFGSYAKDTMDASSDIDILVVGDCSALEIEKTAVLLQKEFGREFNIINLSKEELERKKFNKNPFIKHVFSGKIIRVK